MMHIYSKKESRHPNVDIVFLLGNIKLYAKKEP